MTIKIDPEIREFLTEEEMRVLDPADAEMLGALRLFGPQTSSALMSAFQISRGTVHFRVNRLEGHLQAIQAPGRGNNTVYAAR